MGEEAQVLDRAELQGTLAGLLDRLERKYDPEVKEEFITYMQEAWKNYGEDFTLPHMMRYGDIACNTDSDPTVFFAQNKS